MNIFDRFRPRTSGRITLIHAQPEHHNAAFEHLVRAIEQSDAIVVGAGSGLSTAAGLAYTGPRFSQWFSDFEQDFGFHDMYSGGFYPYRDLEQYWAFWSRHIYCNRYDQPDNRVYRTLLKLVEDRDFFVVTTNVDHQFQLAGIERKRLFYTQGDYGLFQCSEPCHPATYDNENLVRAMIEAQGYVRNAQGSFTPPAGTRARMRIPSELVPRCPTCGRPMAMNLRCDNTFVEDEGWHAAAERYRAFLEAHAGERTLFLELGVGNNTPAIIKYPFWNMASQNPQAIYACINAGEAYCPDNLAGRCILIDVDISQALNAIESLRAPATQEVAR